MGAAKGIGINGHLNKLGALALKKFTLRKLQPVFTHALVVTLALCTVAAAQTSRWSEAKANSWYAREPWLVGSNYVPKTAINQLEMWQETTFDPDQIDREFAWAESLGMNTMRVFCMTCSGSRMRQGSRSAWTVFWASRRGTTSGRCL